ncbi:DUF1254 domain-containing protein [Luteolibacter arcticus]|uniref:DUF1254 domain-containing protein n=1 Tax=Luteolibacter arcticus TaxID=1581411 RepID=A0ABT3GQD4_9BACT|nr:DUF1254 domain-containing protein [Luteolibacter arcticus]MCW1925691.1 DUF1254 domain-containing protein [Luteolibacter arcticus]
MKITHQPILLGAVLVSALATPGAHAQEKTPGFNNKIPEKIMTPDKVESRLGTLDFVDGIPTAETTQKLYDNLDHMRGVEVFLNFIPAASMEGLRLGSLEYGATKSNQAILFDQLMDSNPLYLTGNTDTVYCMSFLDLERDGPTVVEIPPKCGPGTTDDAYFRFVIDMGGPGPDAGKGGKYLILPPDYKGDLKPTAGTDQAEVDGEKYYVAQSTSYVNWVPLRGFLEDGKPDAAVKMFKDGFKVYPLAQKDNPPKMEFISASKKPINTVHANNFEFFHELDNVIQKEPLNFLNPEQRGLLAAIGIVKGKKFAPDERMKRILTDAVAVGNATARAISFRDREKKAPIYPGSAWHSFFAVSDYQWIDREMEGAMNLDARTKFFYGYTVNTPKMMMKLVGAGSQYGVAFGDADGQPFDGAKTYTFNVPANVPAQRFWSVVLYDPQTRSELQTSQPFPGKNNTRDKLITNADGSVDFYFGPKAPEGKEANWLATVPGKGWFMVFRLYSPLEPFFDKSWRLGEPKLVK